MKAQSKFFPLKIFGILAHRNVGALSKINKKIYFSPYKGTAAETVQVSSPLTAVRISCLLRGRRTSLLDGVAAGELFLRFRIHHH